MTNAPHAPIFAIVGPSGAGKNTLINLLLESTTEIKYGVSMTTRDPRPTDAEGEYIYCSMEEIEDALSGGHVLEMAIFADKAYATCTPDPAVPTIIDLELQGAAQIRANHPELPIVFIAILPMPNFVSNPHGTALEHRRHFERNPGLRIIAQLTCLRTQLRGRKDLSEEDIEKRLVIARGEISEIESPEWQEDPDNYTISNQFGQLDAAHRKLMGIIKPKLQAWRDAA